MRQIGLGLLVGCLSASAIHAQPFEIQEATIEGINAAFDAGALTSEALVRMYLDRIDAFDRNGPTLNSIIVVNPNAVATARALDTERTVSGPRSPLHGIPVLLKDNYDTFDMPTTAGSLCLVDSIPPDDAFLVRRLREAGAIILGKTNMPEFAFSGDTNSPVAGQTLNPYDPQLSPGGSSGGTGAAIAANLAVVGTGTDTAGSIRVPSNHNCVVGLRTTVGLTSRDGILPMNGLRDVGGPMARSVADVAVMLDVLAGFDPADPVTAESLGLLPESYTDFLDPAGLEGARIGVVRDAVLRAQSPVRPLIDRAIADMQDLGAQTIDLTGIALTTFDINRLMARFEYDVNRYLKTLGPDAVFTSLEEMFNANCITEGIAPFLRGDQDPADDPFMLAILDQRNAFRTQLLDIMETHRLDALLYTHGQLPQPIGSEGDGDVMQIATRSGFAAITVPAGFTENGLPVSIELMSRPFDEATLIRLAYAYEQATLHRRPPPGTFSRADLDADDDVDLADYLIVAGCFSGPGSRPQTDCCRDRRGPCNSPSDFDGDDDVDIADLIAFQSEFTGSR